jgi:hypothetical protein
MQGPHAQMPTLFRQCQPVTKCCHDVLCRGHISVFHRARLQCSRHGHVERRVHPVLLLPRPRYGQTLGNATLHSTLRQCCRTAWGSHFGPNLNSGCNCVATCARSAVHCSSTQAAYQPTYHRPCQLRMAFIDSNHLQYLTACTCLWERNC